MENNYENLRKLYIKFIDSFNSLSRELEIKSQADIYNFYVYLLYKGYLSKDKIFRCGVRTPEIPNIKGVNVLSGKGNCTDIAPLLTNILQFRLDFAHTIIIRDNPGYIRIVPTKSKFQTREDKRELLMKHSYIRREDIETYLNEIEDCFVKEIKNGIINVLLQYILGNHMITISDNAKEYYIFDPTKRISYTYDNGVLIDEYGNRLPIMYSVTEAISGRARWQINSTFNFPTKDINANRNMVNGICNGNIDMLEDFYNRNISLYNEVSNEIKEYVKKK